MGLCIADLGVARNVQSLFLQGLGEVLGVLDYRLLVLGLEGVHLVCGHQQAKLGAQASRKFVDDVEKKGVDEIKSHGVNVVTQVNNAPFQAALTPAYKQYATKYGQKTLDQIAAVK